ncbi:MAG: site-specific integrase [bacterium]|nr:site-specific integrase [bacterium]
MARVFTGKVVIPGDKIDDYLELMAEAEKEREPFRKSLAGLNEDFADYMLDEKGLTERTARKHGWIVGMFIEFLCSQTDVESLEEVTRGIANTHFRNWWKKKVWSSETPNDLRVALKKFFQFLAAKKGIENEKVLKALK